MSKPDLDSMNERAARAFARDAYRQLREAIQERDELRAQLDRRNGTRRDCAVCGKRTPFAGAVYCSEACAIAKAGG